MSRFQFEIETQNRVFSRLVIAESQNAAFADLVNNFKWILEDGENVFSIELLKIEMANGEIVPAKITAFFH